MKLFSSILIFFLLILTSQGWAQCIKNVDNGKNQNQFVQALSGRPTFILDETFLTDQEFNEIDGPDSFIINPVPSLNSLQYRANTIAIVLPFTFQLHINTLFIDLPPPTLS